jgi:hypothetical protein
MPDILLIAELALTAGTYQRNVIDDLIGHRDLLQTPTLMALLPARLAPRRTPQTPRRGLGEPIRRRRPRRIPRVLSQPPLQLNDLRAQPSDLNPELLDHRSLLDHQSGKLPIRRLAARHITTFAASPPPPAPT